MKDDLPHGANHPSWELNPFTQILGYYRPKLLLCNCFDANQWFVPGQILKTALKVQLISAQWQPACGR
jgi:hypothetical protein